MQSVQLAGCLCRHIQFLGWQHAVAGLCLPYAHPDPILSSSGIAMQTVVSASRVFYNCVQYACLDSALAPF